MSSILSSQGVVVATAMAVSGTVILLALRLQKSIPTTQFPVNQIPKSSNRVLRSCISSVGSKREKSKKKKVHFAKDVVDPRGDSEEFRRQRNVIIKSSSSSSSSSVPVSSMKLKKQSSDGRYKGMPANRLALYNGILKDRVAYSY